MLKVNPTQREEMKGFVCLFFFQEVQLISHRKTERNGVCLVRILHAQPESALEHEITSSLAGCVWGGGSYLCLGSPGDLLQTPPLCQLVELKMGPRPSLIFRLAALGTLSPCTTLPCGPAGLQQEPL